MSDHSPKKSDAANPTSLEHSFGGKWTSEKLTRLEKYLAAYAKVMKHQKFQTLYIDAFAGSGWISLKDQSNPSQLALPEFGDEGAERFVQGSARIALQTDPPVNRNIFIEKDASRVAELQRLKEQFPDVADRIDIRQDEANTYLQRLCAQPIWKKHRAVLFLDPYGMQVEWRTLEMVAKTNAIDLWYLFPLGIGINRLLKKNGQIDEANAARLTLVLGNEDWRSVFFSPSQQGDLFPHAEHTDKIAGFDAIEQFFIARLETVFPVVAKNPVRMLNSRGNPLYSLCFAAANKGRGGKIALRIADHILRTKNGR